jgi:hypothetical protein
LPLKLRVPEDKFLIVFGEGIKTLTLICTVFAYAFMSLISSPVTDLDLGVS